MASTNRVLLLLLLHAAAAALLCLSVASAFPGRRCHGRHTAFFYPNFENGVDKLALFGGAKASGSDLLIAGSDAPSAGGVFYSQPVRLTSRSRPGLSKSFFTSFSFSMDSSKGDGLAFVIAPAMSFYGKNGAWLGLSDNPSDLAHTVVVEFDTSMDAVVNDPSANHVGFDLESLVSLATAEVSDGFSLKEDEKLYAWIDYFGPLKSLQVRLSRSGSERPEKPVLSHSIDLAGFWQDEMFVGFTSSTGNTSQRLVLHSWNFFTRGMRMWGPRFHPGGVAPGEDFGKWHDRPGFWHHMPHDWHHGPHGPHGHEGYPYWPGHNMPFEHPDHVGPHPTNEESWFTGLNDVWSIFFYMIVGILCGAAISGGVLLLRTVICSLHHHCNEDKASGFVLGYQKVPVADPKDADAKVNTSGYQKLASVDTDASTENRV